MRHVAIPLALALALPALGAVAAPTRAPAPASGSAPQKEPDSAKLRPNSGKVVGWVVDAATRRPLSGAAVTVEIDGRFSEGGKGTGTTDAAGRWETRAPLGRISSNLDWGRVLTMHPFSLVFSPKAMMKETRIVDVDQLNVRVSCPGYRPFLGSVRVADANPQGYSLHLEDVWLAPEGSALASFSPDTVQHEMIESLSVKPSVCAPGDTVTVTLVARLPVERRLRYRAFVLSNNSRLLMPDQPLKAQPMDKSQPDRLV